MVIKEAFALATLGWVMYLVMAEDKHSQLIRAVAPRFFTRFPQHWTMKLCIQFIPYFGNLLANEVV